MKITQVRHLLKHYSDRFDDEDTLYDQLDSSDYHNLEHAIRMLKISMPHYHTFLYHVFLSPQADPNLEKKPQIRAHIGAALRYLTWALQHVDLAARPTFGIPDERQAAFFEAYDYYFQLYGHSVALNSATAATEYSPRRARELLKRRRDRQKEYNTKESTNE